MLLLAVGGVGVVGVAVVVVLFSHTAHHHHSVRGDKHGFTSKKQASTSQETKDHFFGDAINFLAVHEIMMRGGRYTISRGGQITSSHSS